MKKKFLKLTAILTAMTILASGSVLSVNAASSKTNEPVAIKYTDITAPGTLVNLFKDYHVVTYCEYCSTCGELVNTWTENYVDEYWA